MSVVDSCAFSATVYLYKGFLHATTEIVLYILPDYLYFVQVLQCCMFVGINYHEHKPNICKLSVCGN